MSVIKGTFFSLFESEKSALYKNERLLFVLNILYKIKKNAKMCKKVLHLYVPFITDINQNTLCTINIVVILYCLVYHLQSKILGKTGLSFLSNCKKRPAFQQYKSFLYYFIYNINIILLLNAFMIRITCKPF